jgi:multiple sugar transport system substrate-binding protein
MYSKNKTVVTNQVIKRTLSRRELVKNASTAAAISLAAGSSLTASSAFAMPHVTSSNPALTTIQSQNDVSGSVKMWVNPLIGEGTEDEALWKGIIKSFNGEFPNVKVKVEVQPWDRRVEKLTTALAAGQGPDVWYINIEDIPNHATNGRLASFDSLLSDEVKADYLPKALAGLTYNETLWAAPILLSVRGTMYNTKLFNEAGIQGDLVTWKQLQDAAPKFKEKDSYLLSFETSSPQDDFYPYFWQAGGQVFSDDGKSVLYNSTEGVEALTFLVGLFQNKYIPESSATAQTSIPIAETPLGMGEVAIGTSESSGIVQLSSAWGDGVLQIGPPFKNKKQAAIGTVAGYAISAKAESKDAAAAWVNYVIRPETMKNIDHSSGYFAPRKSVGSIYGDDPVLGELEKYLPMVQPPPIHPLGRQIAQDLLRPEIEAAIIGEKTPQQALDDATSKANDLIAKQ